jgi:hypothetical protein
VLSARPPRVRAAARGSLGVKKAVPYGTAFSGSSSGCESNAIEIAARHGVAPPRDRDPARLGERPAYCTVICPVMNPGVTGSVAVA